MEGHRWLQSLFCVGSARFVCLCPLYIVVPSPAGMVAPRVWESPCACPGRAAVICLCCLNRFLGSNKNSTSTKRIAKNASQCELLHSALPKTAHHHRERERRRASSLSRRQSEPRGFLSWTEAEARGGERPLVSDSARARRRCSANRLGWRCACAGWR